MRGGAVVDIEPGTLNFELFIDMLTEAWSPDKNTRVKYQYDTENRMKVRNDVVSGKKSLYVYEGRDIMAELDITEGSAKIGSVYVRGLNGELLKERRYIKDESGLPAEVRYYYYPDHIGSVYMVCDEKGMMLERETAGPYGDGKTAGISKHGLSSNMFDADTGLYYFAARWPVRRSICEGGYDPNTGRFLQMDPVITETGLINMYDYCNNNPLNVTDRYGEHPALLLAPVLVPLATAVLATVTGMIFDGIDKAATKNQYGGELDKGGDLSGNTKEGIVDGAIDAVEKAGKMPEVSPPLGTFTTRAMRTLSRILVAEKIAKIAVRQDITDARKVALQSEVVVEACGAIAGGYAGGVVGGILGDLAAGKRGAIAGAILGVGVGAEVGSSLFVKTYQTVLNRGGN